MNKILEQVGHDIHACIQEALPDIKPSDLEKDGAVFYMNGNNGTAFDWYVNGHFPNFFIFYNDKENLGAAKAVLYTNGSMTIYVYGERGHAEPVSFEVQIEASQDELQKLAAILTDRADGRRIWDEDIRVLETDGKVEKTAADQFRLLEDAHKPMIERKKLLSRTAIVSKKVREGGWKIGYGMRDEPTRESDSGWYFCVGDETEEYVNDPENLELWAVNSVLMYDPAIMEFITAPYGTAVVRTSSDKFEPDEPGKKIFIEKK